MSASEPAGDTIARNLRDAITRLNGDIAAVELWAMALATFSRPIPAYDHSQNRHSLRQPGSGDART